MDARTIERIHSAASRAAGMTFGFANQLLFLVTIWYLFWFLHDGSLGAQHDHWVVYDSALAIVFAVAHSVMLMPSTRRRLSLWLPRAFYDSLFCVVTCISLLLLFFTWRTSETVIWRLDGWAATLMHAPFYVSWAALIYSLWLTGLGYQTGWTPFYYWLRREPPPRREFKPRGAYRLIRHPVYLSFLGLIWFTPAMTLDHAVLTAIWTGYIFYGSFLKDRRLARIIGEPYRRYQAQVPGYPLISSRTLVPIGANQPSSPGPGLGPGGRDRRRTTSLSEVVQV